MSTQAPKGIEIEGDEAHNELRMARGEGRSNEPRSAKLPLEELPVEIQEKVLYFRIYEGDEFVSECLDYEERGHGEGAVVKRHAKFSKTVLLASKHFYRLGLPILWRLIPLRRPEDVKQIAWLVKRGCLFFRGVALKKYVKRVEYNIPGEFEPHGAPSLLHAFENLGVVVVRPPPRPGYVGIRHMGYSLHDLVFGGQGLTRIQFDTEEDQPSLYDIQTLLNNTPALVALRVVRLAPAGGPCPKWAGRRPLKEGRRLRKLSLGSETTLGKDGRGLEEFDSMLSMLSVVPVLRDLSSVGLFFESAMVEGFLGTYGQQLEEISIAAPWVDVGAGAVDWAALCPHVTHGNWWGGGREKGGLRKGQSGKWEKMESLCVRIQGKGERGGGEGQEMNMLEGVVVANMMPACREVMVINQLMEGRREEARECYREEVERFKNIYGIRLSVV